MALTASDQDGEAMAAFCASRQMLAEAGLTFLDLMGKPQPHPGRDEGRLWDLERKLCEQQREIAHQKAARGELARQITVLEQALARHSGESRGWRDRAWRIMWEGSQPA